MNNSIPKIFIGTSPNGEDYLIEAVYEYSLRLHSSTDLDIIWMRQTNNKDSIFYNWNTKLWSTPFSGFRWAVAEANNYQGRAIYTDVDMINLCDINELFSIDLRDKPFGAREGSRFGEFELCVMLIDCEMCKEIIPPSMQYKKKKFAHFDFRKKFCNSNLITPIDKSWNCFDGESLNINEIKQIHFTNMPTQPWKPGWYKGETSRHPREDILELYENYLDHEDVKAILREKQMPKPIKYKILGK
jgi:lipopolysaccharide biosynthesis glycosyltransferase